MVNDMLSLNAALNTGFYFLLNMSITASLIGILLILLRLNKNTPGLVKYSLWGLVFVRLVFPFAFSSEISVFNLAKGLIKRVVDAPLSGLMPVGGKIDVTITNYIGAAQDYYPVVYKNLFLEKFFGAAAFIWVIVAAAAILTAVILYILTGSELRKARHLKENTYMSDAVETPMASVFSDRG